MKTIIFYAAMAVYTLSMSVCYAQDNQSNDPITILKNSKEKIILEEKEALKKIVETINSRVENGEITVVEADILKKEAAEKHALNIENRIAIVDNKIELLERNGIDGENKIDLVILNKGQLLNIEFTPKQRKYDRRTTSDLVFAVGLNNVISEDESLDDSEFQIGGSRFAELGWAWKTRVFKNSNWLRFKYGFSFQFNGLKAKDNKYFVDTGDKTELQEFPIELDKSKFRMDNLVFPIHFEFGPSKKIVKDDYFRYDTRDQIKVGVGGYAGFNLSSRQKLKFSQDGEDVKQKLKADYNTNNFIYGVSTYIGWQNTALYLKYDLNSIFKDNPVEMRNISLGLRFDMD